MLTVNALDKNGQKKMHKTLVKIKPEWCISPEEKTKIFVIVSDYEYTQESEDRVLIAMVGDTSSFPPQELVRTKMLQFLPNIKEN